MSFFDQRRWRDFLFVKRDAVTRREAAAETPAHPGIQFEETDISGVGVLLAGFAMLVGIWIIVVLLYSVFALLSHYRAAVSPKAPVMAGERNQLPPEPRLQVSPRIDLQQLRAYEDSELQSYGWVDRKNGVISIPVDRAMQIVAARGIPPQKAPASLKLPVPLAGTRMTGFEGKVEPEPR